MLRPKRGRSNAVPLSISNIAWETAEDEAVSVLLARYGVGAIDIAPGKYFPDPQAATGADMDRVRQGWERKNITVLGMQSLLFGTTGLNLFDPSCHPAMFDHLSAICRIGAGLGARRLTFGSPRNRDRSGLSEDETRRLATAFFTRLGDIAGGHGVTVCLEPNPTRYGANFMTTTEETAAVVRAVAHPAIRLQLDTGAMAINGEDPNKLIPRVAPLIGHIHLCEPDLLPLGSGTTDHARMGEVIRRDLPGHWLTIEMLRPKDVSACSAMEQALKTAMHYYQTER